MGLGRRPCFKCAAIVIHRGRAHPAYKHGQETLQAKRERSAKLKELRDIEGAMTVLGVLDGPRWRGRKPTVRN